MEEEAVERKTWPARLSRWTAELLLVFIGAYAAFWLNSYQEHQEDARRHLQILAALESEVTEAIQSATAERAGAVQTATEFRRALDAGEMPRLGPFFFATDYSASDTAALLESGGYQLLDIKTIVALRKLNSVVRAGLANFAHIEKLSDEMLAPDMDQDPSFFYDPATKNSGAASRSTRRARHHRTLLQRLHRGRDRTPPAHPRRTAPPLTCITVRAPPHEAQWTGMPDSESADETPAPFVQYLPSLA